MQDIESIARLRAPACPAAIHGISLSPTGSAEPKAAFPLG
jgi:hypothetical protein